MTIQVKCFKCGDVIEGDCKGTLIWCRCETMGIDETPYYCRVIGNLGIDGEIIE